MAVSSVHKSRAYERYAHWDKSRNDGMPPSNTIKIKCVETGNIFSSITEAAKEMNLPLSTISFHIKNPEKYKNVRGFTFEKQKA